MAMTDNRYFIPEPAAEGFFFEVERLSEASDRLVELGETYDADPHKALEEVEALDVYKARRVLAIALATIHDQAEEIKRHTEA